MTSTQNETIATAHGRAHYADLALTGRHAWINTDTGAVQLMDTDGDTKDTLTAAEAIALADAIHTHRYDLDKAARRGAERQAWQDGARTIAALLDAGVAVKGLDVTYFRSDYSSQVAVISVDNLQTVTDWAEVVQEQPQTDDHTWENGIRRVQTWVQVDNVVVVHTVHVTPAETAVA